ncbi:hypothetical protein KAR91_54220 [Candidatus Pacearchaeota archaeon]|nr:hypothetical protein [Candidatus Pacearchaeota archaeon]
MLTKRPDVDWRFTTPDMTLAEKMAQWPPVPEDFVAPQLTKEDLAFTDRCMYCYNIILPSGKIFIANTPEYEDFRDDLYDYRDTIFAGVDWREWECGHYAPYPRIGQHPSGLWIWECPGCGYLSTMTGHVIHIKNPVFTDVELNPVD